MGGVGRGTAVAVLASPRSRERTVRRRCTHQAKGRRMDTQAPLLTIKETARALNLSERSVWELIRLGKLRSTKILSTRRVPVAAVEALIEASVR